MSTKTQFNPNNELNAILIDAGASKTVYALVTPQTEAAKSLVFGNEGDSTREGYLDMFRGAWTKKQDALHEEFFETWHAWAAPVLDLSRSRFPHFYPTAGASEPIRQLIFDFAVKGGKAIHVFRGEYEGYKAMAEAAGLEFVEHHREDYRLIGALPLRSPFYDGEALFFISQPSAIDGSVWPDFNAFLSFMPMDSVVVDVTYVGAVPSVIEKFALNSFSVRNVIFSLSKPFGCYYDRIGGVFCRDINEGLFGNKWFKNLTSLRLGTVLMQQNDVFSIPRLYAEQQRLAVAEASAGLGFDFAPADVFILATAETAADTPMAEYLRRAGKLRLCLTPTMDRLIRVTGEPPLAEASG